MTKYDTQLLGKPDFNKNNQPPSEEAGEQES